MLKVYEIKQGDNTRLRFNIVKKSTGEPIDLTGATCTLVIAGGNVYSQIVRTCVISDPVNGQCLYDLQATDTNTLAGQYRVEIKIDGVRDFTTLENAMLIVKEVIPINQ